jgi:tetratricopeptide (TPR) repeat protein
LTVLFAAEAPALANAAPPHESGEESTEAEAEAAAESDPALDEAATRARALFFDGSAQFSAADYDGAIEKFTEALKIVTSAGLDPKIRGALLINLARAHRKAYDTSRDLTHLRVSLDIYNRIDREAERGGYSAEDVSDATKGLEQLTKQIAEIEAQEREAKQAPPPAAEPSPGSGDEGDEDDESSGKRNAGIALAAAGGVLLAGGVGALAWGTTYKGYAEQSVADAGEEGFESANEYIDMLQGRGVQWMAAGGVAAGIGVAGLVTGIVMVSKSKKTTESARLRVAPQAGRGTAGLTVFGRF